MKPIVFFTDAGKDGDDLAALISVLQAKSAGVIPMDTPIYMVTTDEVPSTEKGIQDLDGQYGLRALYLNMQLTKFKQQLPSLPPEAFPIILVGPKTTYYQFNPEKKAFYNVETDSVPFYPTEEVQEYYAKTESDKSTVALNAGWIEKLQQATPDGATLVSIAAFDAVSDFISAIPGEKQQNFSLTTMGYNKPYSQDEYAQKITKPNALPYNARSTDPHKASQAISNITKLNSFHVVSESTRAVPKYDQNSWLNSYSEIMGRAYPLYAGRYAESSLSAIVEFMKHSKYHAFWPHDVVASLAALIEQGQWEKLQLPKLKKEMLFTGVETVKGQTVNLRMVGKTGVLIDANVAIEENDISIGTEAQSFTFGKEVDAIFFTALLHFTAIEALPAEQKKEFDSLQAGYRNILNLKAQSFDLKHAEKIEPTEIQSIEKQINATWTLISLKELQSQLAAHISNEDVQYILGKASFGYSLAKLTNDQAKALSRFVGELIAWGEQLEDKTLLNNDLLKFIKDLAEALQAMDFDLTDPIISNLQKALQQVSVDKKFTALTTTLFSDLRQAALMTQRVNDLLKEDGKLAVEFKRTGNSLLHARAALHGNLAFAFPVGIHGMTESYKDMLSLKNQKPSYGKAFFYHLIIHDAGKGDIIKKAVRMNEEGIYFIELENNFYRLELHTRKPQKASKEEFDQATAHVDHDAALEVYAITGAHEKSCSLTEFLIWGGPNTEIKDKEKIAISDELITLCNETNIAQIIQGEIPFEGVKKGLDLFFKAYQQDPMKAELIFVHHCYDILGSSGADVFTSTAGKDPEIHIKINLLYETLLQVAQESLGEKASSEAYHRYRQKLAISIPEITPQDKSQESVILAKTRIAQMLRCHLFKTQTHPDTKQLVISEQGAYEKRTQLFVEAMEIAVGQLAKPAQDTLIALLNRNAGNLENPAIMVMYGPKLLLTAIAGAEYGGIDPTDKQVIAERLTPMLNLYIKLYEHQAFNTQAHNAVYGVIDVKNLALITQALPLWYQAASAEQKNNFADLLFFLQQKGLTQTFLDKLGKTNLLADKETQLAKVKEVLATLDTPFEVSEAGLVAKTQKAETKTHEETVVPPTTASEEQSTTEKQATIEGSTHTSTPVKEEVLKADAKSTETSEKVVTPPKAVVEEDKKVEKPVSLDGSTHTSIPPKVTGLTADGESTTDEKKQPTITAVPKTTLDPDVSQIVILINKATTKAEKQKALLDQIAPKTLSTIQYHALYQEIQGIDELNEHRNPRLDSFFGIKNTTTWRNTLETFRQTALKALFDEVSTESDRSVQIAMLEQARGLSLFNEHRNNSIFTGAWGRTTAVRQIDEKLEALRTNQPSFA